MSRRPWRLGGGARAADATQRLAGAARALAAAARASPRAVCDALLAAVRDGAPQIDALLLYEAHDHALRCTVAGGERVAYYAGTALALDDAAAVAVRALRSGHRARGVRGVRSVHPADADALAVPFDDEPASAAVVVLLATEPLRADAVERAVMLAEIAAPSFLVARDRERDRRTAEYDGLTGLHTPRALRRRLGTLVDRARARPDGALALIFVDTDNFKECRTATN